tara:strand:- start:7637 stop:8620 length:984 start_codon:yes stop_codon:yes gene_type:complete
MIYFILGNHWLITKKKQELRNLKKVKKSDIKNLEAKGLFSDSFSNITTLLNQSSMFGEGSWVETNDLTELIKGLDEKKNILCQEKFKLLYENKTEGNWIISEEKKDYENNKKIKNKIESFIKDIKNKKNIQIFFELLPKNFKNSPDLEKYILNMLTVANYKFSKNIARKILNQVGFNLAAIDQSIETLKMLGHEKKEIDEEMIPYLPKNSQSTVFKIVDFLVEKKTIEAKNLALDLKRNGEDPFSVLGWMTQEWKRLALAKNGNNDILKKDLGPTMLWKSTKLASKAKSIPEKKISKGFRLLSKADLDLKSSDVDPWIIIDSLIYNL